MRPAIERLRAEVRSDREAVSRWLDELAGIELGPAADRSRLAQAAWALHHAYSGIEAILERTMRTIEGSLPEGPDFHKALLDAAALTLEGVRPPLLAPATVSFQLQRDPPCRPLAGQETDEHVGVGDDDRQPSQSSATARLMARAYFSSKLLSSIKAHRLATSRRSTASRYCPSASLPRREKPF